jgi:CRISPR-associated endonuclease/helicase Cas3
VAGEVTTIEFADLVQRATATGHAPYPYQSRLARDGLPELLRVPTGCGKTLAATLPWLYRRRFHPDSSVREGTPHWLVFTLPMRTLVEQTYAEIQKWVERLELEREIEVHRVMGGEGRVEGRWREHPERDAIFVGTLDMLLSRALNRGYGASRFVWPIDFGLFNNGCHWVFDEVQLMGPALPTSRQLDGLRRALGSARGCSTTWMSATVDEAALRTVDNREIGDVVDLSDDDRASGLAPRLDARKRIEEVSITDAAAYERAIADAAVAAHVPATLTLVICNMVDRARNVFKAVRGAVASDGPELVLLHSRFRPGDRAVHVEGALRPVDEEGPGRIVVATQVIEAGVDISANVLFTDAAPWPSIVQRAGRCNRDGLASGARLLWAAPPKALPYEQADVDAAVAALRALNGEDVTPATLGGREVAVTTAVHPVLRRRDLVGLFDTTADLSGNDLDVSRYLREGNDLDVQVAWREISASGPLADEPMPTREELCAIPVAELRSQLPGGKGHGKRAAWFFDHLAASWRVLDSGALRPGQLVLLRAADGGYDASTGWDPKHGGAVAVFVADEPDPLTLDDRAIESDPLTFAPRQWVGLADHLADVEREARVLGDAYACDGLSPEHLVAAVVAGRLHDIGKAHHVFQDMLVASSGDDAKSREHATAGRPWAKSGGSGRPRYARRYFRHELASLLMLLGEGRVVLDRVPEPDLVRYLVAAHHGRVRLSIRSLPEESPHPDGGRVALGVWDGDKVDAVVIPGGEVPSCTLDLGPMELGDGPGGEPSWTARVLALRDRDDLGPFRLGFLEAVVRLADWRASASYERETR